MMDKPFLATVPPSVKGGAHPGNVVILHVCLPLLFPSPLALRLSQGEELLESSRRGQGWGARQPSLL